MALHYHCKLCEEHWSGDCWCPKCGRISKVDHKREGWHPGGQQEPAREKWTKKGAKRAAIVRRAKWKARNR